MATSLSFAVVIPMYNEEAGAERCVRTICQALDALPYRTALIVVDDGSHDRTGEILSRLLPEYERLVVLTHEQNLGYGGGLRTGGRRAAKMGLEYVLFMDSDLTNDPKYLPVFVEKMLAGYDVIKATRYAQGGKVAGVPAWRLIISLVGNWLAHLLYRLPVRDCTNGFRAVKTSILQQMDLHENGFAIIMEELYQAKFLTKAFCEVPYILTVRPKALKPSSFIYRPSVFYGYFRYAIKSFLNQTPEHLSKRAQQGI